MRKYHKKHKKIEEYVKKNKNLAFLFGENWKKFLNNIGEERIKESESNLLYNLDKESFSGLSFIDVGSGSGLSSLAAHNLGADVTSFDVDQHSVDCTKDVKEKFAQKKGFWQIENGSVLDKVYISSLGKFDIVYSWGVLHHTGDMWQALSNLLILTKSGSEVYIALYNQQGMSSKVWWRIKKLYCVSPKVIQHILVLFSFIRLWIPTTIKDILKGQPFNTWRSYKKNRGMHPWRDVVDWVGGFPFEVSTPEEVFNFFKENGFELLKLRTCGGGHGCNEFVFRKN